MAQRVKYSQRKKLERRIDSGANRFGANLFHQHGGNVRRLQKYEVDYKDCRHHQAAESNPDPHLPPAVSASGYYYCLFVLLIDINWDCLPESLVRKDANAAFRQAVAVNGTAMWQYNSQACHAA